MFRDDELEESEKFYVGQPRFLLLFYAMYNTLVARSEMVCYFVIILNQTPCKLHNTFFDFKLSITLSKESSMGHFLLL